MYFAGWATEISAKKSAPEASSVPTVTSSGRTSRPLVRSAAEAAAARAPQKESKDTGRKAVVVVAYDAVTVLDMSNKQIARATVIHKDKQIILKGRRQVKARFVPGITLEIGSKDVKLGRLVTSEEFLNGSVFMGTEALVDFLSTESAEDKLPKRILLAAARRPKPGTFRVPYKRGRDDEEPPNARRTRPLHSPYEPNALVLYKPTAAIPGKVAVVVDPILGDKLRPHQRVGVQFMFDCLTGLNGKSFRGNGCILADDMGLGKSLQALTILFTMLKQGPEGLAVAEKAMIVAPSSLVGNWVAEVDVWLKGGQINLVAIGTSSPKNKAKLSKFMHDFAVNLLIISYDQLKKYCGELSKVKKLGLVIADEGHRLKNAAIQTSKAIDMLPTPRRIILSGTPIQNDLMEFHAMCSFVNPGVLDDGLKFKNVFEQPILRSREPDCDEEIREVGRARGRQLSALVEQFILRRTSDVNMQYLPPKTEYTIFIKLTDCQRNLYSTLCRHLSKAAVTGSAKGSLPLITLLKKLCNTPDLIYEAYHKASDCKTEIPAEVEEFFPDYMKPKAVHPELSGKMTFQAELLRTLVASTDEKIVIVSNHTATLKYLAVLCNNMRIGFFQLDGSTPVDKRQQLVVQFNQAGSKERVFLLSSKAGGCGLNLIGANHLVMFDGDWNPANDAQALARVWRPGQKKPCYIYRLCATGTIEEKIYQRQVAKMALSTSIVEQKAESPVSSFNISQLRDLFTLRSDTICDTHDLLCCRCCGKFNRPPAHKIGAVNISELATWSHFSDVSQIVDPVLHETAKLLEPGRISFLFRKTINDKKQEEEEFEDDEVIVDDTTIQTEEVTFC